MSKLDGHIAIVTGAARGNGQGIARALSRQGATVILTDVLDSVEETARSIASEDGKAVAFTMDVTDREEVRNVIDNVMSRFGRIDTLVNNAGVVKAVPFMEISDNMKDEILNVNINGTWNCIKAVLPRMLERQYGSIINISSVTGPFVAYMGETAYAMTKAAICGLTKALALEVARRGVTVNAVCPGYIETPMTMQVATEVCPDNPQSVIDQRSNCIPVGRFGTIEEIGNLVCFLSSQESRYITGSSVVIDGGSTLVEPGTPLDPPGAFEH